MASNLLLAQLPDYRDNCGCSLMDGRCETHRSMMVEIHDAWFGTPVASRIVSSFADGYGEVGYAPDWSAIRDSSTAAIEAMHKAIHA